MAKSIRANLELASANVCRNIAEKDAQKVSSKAADYVDANLLGYYVAVNTWLLLIKEWSQYGWVYVLNFLKENGLFEAIRSFDGAAAEVINGADVSFSIARTLMRDIASHKSIIGVPNDGVHTMHTDQLSATLFLFRYLKRFSPLKADVLNDASLADFVKRQGDLKRLQRRLDAPYIFDRVREAAAQLLDWDALLRDLDSFSIKDLEFTTGVSFDTRADLVSKLRRVAKDRVEYFPIPFGIPLVAHTSATEMAYWGARMDNEVHAVRISAVPKNYKTARVIAPEDVVRQATARRYFTLMDRHLPALIRLHDQSQNQALALEGSRTGRLATIDLHAASDSITLTHLYEIFPRPFVEKMRQVLPTHFVHQDKTRLLQSAATMGNSVTFWLESVLFASVSLAAVRYYNEFSGETDETVSIYGDDIIVPTNAAITVIEWLERLGFVVNEDKSFFSPTLLYRESCGEEYFEGRNVSSLYYPRFPIDGKLGGSLSNKSFRDGFTGAQVDSMTSLIDLQHKLWGVCVPASMLVVELIREADPRITESTPDEGYTDIWGYESKPKVGSAPVAKGTVVDDSKPWMLRYRHSTPVSGFPTANRTAEDEVLFNLYKYQRFLRYGPQYESDLDELLGISMAPMTFSQASTRGEVKWVYLER